MNKRTYRWIRENNYTRFNYGEYSGIELLGTRCLIHKFLNWDGVSHLYQYGVAPSGVAIVCDIDNYNKIVTNAGYSPISIQTLSPYAPLTSSIMNRIAT